MRSSPWLISWRRCLRSPRWPLAARAWLFPHLGRCSNGSIPICIWQRNPWRPDPGFLMVATAEYQHYSLQELTNIWILSSTHRLGAP